MPKKKIYKEELDSAFDMILKERRGEIYDIFSEAIEDYLLGKEIEKGLNSGIANKSEVYRLLKKNGHRIHKKVQG